MWCHHTPHIPATTTFALGLGDTAHCLARLFFIGTSTRSSWGPYWVLFLILPALSSIC